MATKYWRGDAPAAEQQETTAITTYDAATTYSITINGKVISTIGQGSEADTTSDLVTKINDSTIPEFAELTASQATTSIANDSVRLTAGAQGVIDGKPFTATYGESGGTGAWGSTTTNTSPTGPNWFSEPDNWSDGAAPTTGDVCIFEDNDIDCLFGLDDQSAQTLTELHVRASYTGRIGLPAENNDNNPYYEYRTRELTIGATDVWIGQGDGPGSARLYLNMSSIQTTLHVYRTGASENDLPPLTWRGTHASNVANLYRGEVGVGVLEHDQAATIATLRVGHRETVVSDVNLLIGSNVTLTTIDKTGGEVEMNSVPTTLNQWAGQCTVNGSAALTTINLWGGTLFYASSGTITTLNVGNDAVADFSRDSRGRTITNTSVYPGGSLLDPYTTLTLSNNAQIPGGGLEDVTVVTGVNVDFNYTSI